MSRRQTIVCKRGTCPVEHIHPGTRLPCVCIHDADHDGMHSCAVCSYEWEATEDE